MKHPWDKFSDLTAEHLKRLSSLDDVPSMVEESVHFRRDLAALAGRPFRTAPCLDRTIRAPGARKRPRKS